jgi:hypothetical protein
MGYLDELKKLIYEQTQKVGVPIGNIYGVAQSTLQKLTATERSSWLALALPSRTITNIDGFYALYSSLKTGTARKIETETGAVVYENLGAETVSVLLRGSIELAQARSITFAIQLGDDQASFIAQMDGHVIKQGNGSAEIGVYLDTGMHTLEVLAASNAVGVQVPQDLRVSADFERVSAPTWISVTTGYVDAIQGQATVQLSWHIDTKAGGWRVLRRQLVELNTIQTVGVVDQTSEYSAIITGDQSALLVGMELFAAHELMGIVLGVVPSGADSLVRLRLPSGRLATSDYWTGRTAMQGTFVEIQRVGRTQAAGAMSWSDNNVTGGQFYDYALQAWGFLDSNTWSALSDVRFIKAGDQTPPSAIVFVSTYPAVVDRRAIVKFTTPSESDYAGVRVYYREKYTGTATSSTATSITNSGATFGALTSAWTVRITSGTGAGQERVVVSGTTTTITVDTAWQTNPDATSVYLVYKDSPVMTDYGLPSTTDELSFAPVDTDPGGPVQEYQFRTFDNAFNEQIDTNALVWTFDPGDAAVSGWTSPPIVGIRQVPVLHPTLVGQDDFAAPYNNNTNFVIVELSASDVAGRTGAVTLFYQRRGDTSPISLPATSAPTLEGGTPAVVDAPSGTRSRYIPIARTLQDNWIKVYAVDSDGNKSSTTAYTVDYNALPEVSSFEGRVDPTTVLSSVWNSGTNPFGTGTVNTAGVVWVSGAVDDDTSALKYWLEDPTGTDPTLSAPRVLDRTLTRSFEFVFSLGDGERKKLILEPWSAAMGALGADPTLVAAPSTGLVSLSATSTTYVRATGSFISDGFVVGQVVYASGFSNSQNNGASVVTTVAATVLTVLKVGGLVTESAGANRTIAAGVSGTTVEREFVRSARAQANFEDRDQSGNVSGKTVKVLFDILPLPLVQTPTTTGGTLHVHASGSTTTTLKASTSPSWTTNQWASQAPKKYFVITNPNSTPWSPLETQVRSIVSNTADTLTLDRSWSPIPHSALFWIVDSAVMYRIDALSDTTPFYATGGMVLVGSNYKPTTGLAFFDRKTGSESTTVEYFAVKNKVPDEGTNRVTVDADTIPEFAEVTMVEISPNNVRLTVVGPDDDVKLWRAYRRKGTWPTASGTLPNPLTSASLDLKYLHHTDTVDHLTYDSFAGTGQQYVVVVPVNSMNQDGPPVTKTVAVSGNLGNPRLESLRTSHYGAVGASGANLIQWNHPNIADASTAYHVKVLAYRKVAASGVTDVASSELTPGGFVRLATFDSEAGNPLLNTDDSQSINGQGSWVHVLPSDRDIRATAATGVAYTWVYSVDLYDGTNSLVGTYTVEDTDYYVPPACHVLTCSASITDHGIATLGSDGHMYCQTHPTRVVTWTADNTGTAGFSVRIELSTEATPTTWTLVASGLDPAAGEWTQSDWGYSGLGTTEVRYWTYRAYAVRATDGTTSGSVRTATQLTDTIDFCESGGEI